MVQYLLTTYYGFPLSLGIDNNGLCCPQVMNEISVSFSTDIRHIMADVVKFLVAFHQNLKSSLAPFLTDHILFRVVTGVIVAAPEEINRLRTSGQQCDEMGRLFVNIWQLTTIKIYPKA